MSRYPAGSYIFFKREKSAAAITNNGVTQNILLKINRITNTDVPAQRQIM